MQNFPESNQSTMKVVHLSFAYIYLTLLFLDEKGDGVFPISNFI